MLVTVRVLWHETHPTSVEVANLFQLELVSLAPVNIEARSRPFELGPSSLQVITDETEDDGTMVATMHVAEAVQRLLWRQFGVHSWRSVILSADDLYNEKVSRLQLTIQMVDEAHREIRNAVRDLKRSRSHDPENAVKAVGEVRQRLERLVS